MISNSKMFQWMHLKNYKLKSKLIITYLLLIVVPISLLGYISYYIYSKSIVEQVGEYVPRILDQAIDNIDKQMRELENLPELLSNSSQVITILRKDTNPTQSDFLNDRFFVNSYLARTYINTNDSKLFGVFVWSKNRLFSSTNLPYTGFESEPVFSEKEKIILPSETSLRFEGNRPFVLIMRQIEDYDNRKNIGTIFIAVDLSFADKILSDLQEQGGAELRIMNRKGETVYDTNPGENRTVLNIDEFPILNGSFRTTNGNAEETLISVSQSMQTDWVLVHSIPMKYLTQKTDATMKWFFFIFLVIMFAAGSISIYLAWSVSRPIIRLSRLMGDVERQNFQVDLTVDSKDEIGVLTRSFNSMVKSIRDLIQKNYQIEIRQKQAELYALQSQINPHFMYNALETINMAVEEDDKETTVKMVTMLGKMLRFSLSNKDRIVTIDKEVEHIKNYLSIQKIRFEDRLDFEIVSEIDLSQYYTAKFILQPVIENCIKHGLETRGNLTIRTIVKKEFSSAAGKEEIHLTVEDNGSGIDWDKLAEINQMLSSDPISRRDSGFGLINVNARISMLFGADYGLTVQSELSKGTKVVIRIPAIDGFSVMENDQ